MKNVVEPSDLKRTASTPSDNIVVLDTETTGLTPGKDEVLSIAIVDIDGNKLFYSLIRPLNRKRWPNATEIHGITWSDVKDKPTIYDVGNEVAEVLENASLIVGYNVDFDIEMLEKNGLPSVRTETYDLMEEYAKAYGRWSDRKDGYLWCKLEQCARRYGYQFEAHDALEDAKATAHCFNKFREECIKELPIAIEQEKERQQRAAELEEKSRKERAERAVLEENERKTRSRNKIIRMAVGAVACGVSIGLFLNSCSIAGGDVFGSLGIVILSFVLFISGGCLMFI